MRSFALFAAMSLIACSGDAFDVGSTPADASTADTSSVKDSSASDTTTPRDTDTPADTSTERDTSSPIPDTAVPIDTMGQCVSAADCKKYSSYCADDPCRCIPLRSTDPTPKCTSGEATCIVDPCEGKSADCVAGVCVIR